MGDDALAQIGIDSTRDAFRWIRDNGGSNMCCAWSDREDSHCVCHNSALGVKQYSEHENVKQVFEKSRANLSTFINPTLGRPSWRHANVPLAFQLASLRVMLLHDGTARCSRACQSGRTWRRFTSLTQTTATRLQMGGKTFAVAIIPLSTSTNSGSVRGLISRGHETAGPLSA